MDHKEIIISHANQGNLRDLSVRIPRNKLVVFTGLSGSGKSTLLVDTLFNECQRQYLEAISMQGIQKPDVESIKNVSAAVLISQTKHTSNNPRSTVGTATNIYTDLRLIYEKLATRACPNCQALIGAAECKEITEKIDGEFKVYMICSHCDFKMDKLTRSHFSHNTKDGACPTCQGLGSVKAIDWSKLLQPTLSTEEGGVLLWQGAYKDYSISNFYAALKHYGIPVTDNTPVKDYSVLQREILEQGIDSAVIRKHFPAVIPPKTVAKGRYEGIAPALWRRLSEKGDDSPVAMYFSSQECPDCHGDKLNGLSRQATVLGLTIPETSRHSLRELSGWIQEVGASLRTPAEMAAKLYVEDIITKVRRITDVGLDYLTLDRQFMTLSGGEAQRIKLAALLDASDLTGMIYVMDEPTMGLHPSDTAGIITVLKQLRDNGNTVLVIEHDTEVMRAADHIIDIGPGSGKHGGTVIGEGTLEQLFQQETSVTGQYIKHAKAEPSQNRDVSRRLLKIERATLHNLKDITVEFPLSALTAVTGVSGSGKSTLVFDVLGQAQQEHDQTQNIVTGLDNFDTVITIGQSQLSRMRRSNVATYSDAYTEIRTIFASLPEAKAKSLSSKHFSFNTAGGRCENCEGLGVVSSHMLFFADIEVTCPVCGGKRFSDSILSIEYKGMNISEILNLSIEDAKSLFDNEKLAKILGLLSDVGLDYLELGQSLTTLSGGEGQRLKLAKELLSSRGSRKLYLIDEPTVGLHPRDVQNFLRLVHHMVDAGNTVIIVEHNAQVIQAADWVIDLGPAGGSDGGKIVATGQPTDIKKHPASLTGKYI